ncbi:cell wall-binding repeat-containing protein [Clostridium kluyveri]|uniref:Cell wall-binding repeat 2 family protein n=1 Tax=Clostridium kluyveri TaxID=1534 RepID=A0A1L5F7F7_CLOKL|nr:cell wall-binding repeat-containing protein [Clostridium kluyveri]APM38902.1 hypothetical protein BS101_09130 [Clostridium kluyveri]
MKEKGKKTLSVYSIMLLLVFSFIFSINVKAENSSSIGINRIGGADRYETAVKIAQAGWQSSDYAILANGENYPDALCAVPLAKTKDAPVLLTTGSNLNQDSLNKMKELKVKHVIVVGGKGAISDNIISDIKSQGISDVERIGGQNRYETSVKIAEKLGTVTKAVVTSGEGYADALSACTAAAIEKMPILLTKNTDLPDVTADYIKSNPQITTTYIIGGTGSISTSVDNELQYQKRIYGLDRYETNAAVLNEFASDFDFKNVYLALGNGATGSEFADALTGGALAAKMKSPLVITGKTLSSATEKFIKEKIYKDCNLTVIGGTANISDSLAQQIRDSSGASETSESPTGGSSSGGGSGSSSYKNITSAVKEYSSYKDIVSSINNGEYFKLEDDNSDTMNLQLKKDNVNPIQGVFQNAVDVYTSTGTVDEQQIRYDVEKVNEEWDVIYGKNITVKIGEDTKSLSAFFGSLGSKYFDSNGKLNADIIVEQVNKKLGSDYDYDDFRTNLIEGIKNYFDNNSSLEKNSLQLKIMGLKVNSIKKGTSTLYTSTSYGKDALNKLIDILIPSADTDITGVYTIYIEGNNYIKIDVKNADTAQPVKMAMDINYYFVENSEGKLEVFNTSDGQGVSVKSGSKVYVPMFDKTIDIPGEGGLLQEQIDWMTNKEFYTFTGRETSDNSMIKSINLTEEDPAKFNEAYPDGDFKAPVHCFVIELNDTVPTDGAPVTFDADFQATEEGLKGYNDLNGETEGLASSINFIFQGKLNIASAAQPVKMAMDINYYFVENSEGKLEVFNTSDGQGVSVKSGSKVYVPMFDKTIDIPGEGGLLQEQIDWMTNKEFYTFTGRETSDNSMIKSINLTEEDPAKFNEAYPDGDFKAPVHCFVIELNDTVPTDGAAVTFDADFQATEEGLKGYNDLNGETEGLASSINFIFQGKLNIID